MPTLSSVSRQAAGSPIDGRYYTNSARWASTSPFSITLTGATGSPQYQIRDPGGNWGPYVNAGVVTDVVGTLIDPVLSPIIIPSVSGASINGTVESNPVTISTQGHQIRLKLTAGSSNSETRTVTWTVGVGHSGSWSVTTVAGAPAGYAWDPTPTTGNVITIPTSVTLVNNNTGTYQNQVPAGTTLVLAGGTRAPITFQNLRGTPQSPIVIVNQAGGSVVDIVAATATTIVKFKHCEYVIFDGGYKYSGASPTAHTYGIKISKSGNVEPGMAIAMNGDTSDITVRNVWIDGGWNGSMAPITGGGIKIGLRLGDTEFSNPATDISRANYPGRFRKNCLFEWNKIENMIGTAVYVGQNLGGSVNTNQSLVDGLPLMNITFRHNIVQNGWGELVDLKGVEAGYLRCYNNYVRDAGLGQQGTDDVGEGIQVYECTNCDIEIYNNTVLHAAQYGISVETQHQFDRGPTNVTVYNNQVYDAGWGIVGTGFGFGIKVGSSVPDNGLPAVQYQTVRVYNNTVHITANNGIDFPNERVVLPLCYNNVVSQAAQLNASKSAYPSWVGTGKGNITATGTAAKFVQPSGGASPYSALDLRLQSDSPAVGAGVTTVNGSAVPVPTTDINGNARPNTGGNILDSGAHEFA